MSLPHISLFSLTIVSERDPSKEVHLVRKVVIDQEQWPAFQQLIQRGSNLWPDAPPEIKEFADLVTNGKVMQDYRAQAASTTKTKD